MLGFFRGVRLSGTKLLDLISSIYLNANIEKSYIPNVKNSRAKFQLWLLPKWNRNMPTVHVKVRSMITGKGKNE